MKKHMKGRSRLYITLIAACVLALLVGIFAIATAAASSIETVGEMVDIKTIFADYLVQDTVRAKDDGYVGETQYTVYYDTSKGKVKTEFLLFNLPPIVTLLSAELTRAIIRSEIPFYPFAFFLFCNVIIFLEL